jgi:hypothetical protein
VRIVNAGIDNGNSRAFAPNALSMELVDAGPLMHRVIVALEVQCSLDSSNTRRHWDSLHGPNIGHAVDSAERVDVVNVSLDDNSIENVTAVELPEVRAIGRSWRRKLACHITNAAL